MAANEEVTEYERMRLDNIRRNEEELAKLGLQIEKITLPARGSFAPNKETIRRRAVPPRSRWSSRLKGIEPVDYGEGVVRKAGKTLETPERSRKRPRTTSPTQVLIDPRSIRNLAIDLKGLAERWLGKIIPPAGGQVKRAVMDEASLKGTPKFSRMSGIQEWKNGIMLFVNVYGEGYKNGFLQKGRYITWFAQNRQWEGTPVIERMINSMGGTNAEGKDVKPTPILLFCRNLGEGYVYCGRLIYNAHDPDRIPIRFVWQLADFEKLKDCENFERLVEECNRVLS